MSQILCETLNYTDALLEVITEGVENDPIKPKKFYMKGIFIQGGVRNQNGRIYPVEEIQRAIDKMNLTIKKEKGIKGELNHPDNLSIDLKNVSHVIEEMWKEGGNGMGKLRVLKTPSGEIVKALIEEKVSIGVSSRGAGDVGNNGIVSNFEIKTVDIVADPSAPEAFPTPIQESIERYRKSNELKKLAEAINHDNIAKKYFKREIANFINSLNLK